MPPVDTNVHVGPPADDEGNRKRPKVRSFSAKIPTVVQLLLMPLSFNPAPPPALDDESLVDVEKRPGGTESGTIVPGGLWGVITLRERDEEDESIGSPIRGR